MTRRRPTHSRAGATDPRATDLHPRATDPHPQATNPHPRAAFEELYRSTRTDLLRYLVRRTAEAEEAADLLAETYATAWRKLESIPAGEQARLWLFGVARNLLLRSVRRHRVAEALIERLSAELRMARATELSDEPALTTLRAALRELPERDREILTLTAWEGLTPREIAKVMATSPNSVRIRLHRARKHLESRLASTPDVDPAWRTRAPVVDS